jgi:hypothetical protein
MCITKAKEESTMWREGAMVLGKGNIYHYEIKVYEEPSEYGIAGGKISKLLIKQDGKEVASYDRGWDKEPTSEEAEIALAILLKEHN